jgi:hypothetical protein
MKALLDTDILSEVLKSKDPHVLARASAYLAEHGRYTLSTITVMEVVKGLSRRGREDALMRLVARSPRWGATIGRGCLLPGICGCPAAAYCREYVDIQPQPLLIAGNT